MRALSAGTAEAIGSPAEQTGKGTDREQKGSSTSENSVAGTRSSSSTRPVLVCPRWKQAPITAYQVAVATSLDGPKRKGSVQR